MKPNPLQPRTTRAAAAALALACLAAGCLTERQLIERRIGQKSDVFEALPAEDQQRLREGRVAAGDTPDAVWIAFGRPDRVLEKVTAASTNEVWSYVTQLETGTDELRPVYHPVRTRGGGYGWRTDSVWVPRTRHLTIFEYRRVEFQDGRVLSVETEKP